jgi:large subunit ribosomal protein L21
MYAIVKAGGIQFKVSPFDVIRVPKMANPEGEELKLGEVLLIRSQEGVMIGRPVVEGAEVSAKVLGHGRYRKVRGFKFKKRKKYRRTWGAREAYTEVVITGISAPGLKPEVEEKAKAKPKRKKPPARKAPLKKDEAPKEKAELKKKKKETTKPGAKPFVKGSKTEREVG